MKRLISRSSALALLLRTPDSGSAPARAHNGTSTASAYLDAAAPRHRPAAPAPAVLPRPQAARHGRLPRPQPPATVVATPGVADRAQTGQLALRRLRQLDDAEDGEPPPTRSSTRNDEHGGARADSLLQRRGAQALRPSATAATGTLRRLPMYDAHAPLPEPPPRACSSDI
jgi:hypothetical protein